MLHGVWGRLCDMWTVEASKVDTNFGPEKKFVGPMWRGVFGVCKRLFENIYLYAWEDKLPFNAGDSINR